MNNERNVSKLISKLTRSTMEGAVKWQRRDVPRELDEGTSDRFPVYLETRYKGARIGLATRRYQEYSSETDGFFWAERIVLVFIADNGQVLWEYQDPSAGLHNLYEVARESSANLRELLTRLLDDDDEDVV